VYGLSAKLFGLKDLLAGETACPASEKTGLARFNGVLDKGIGPSTGRPICWQDRQPNRPLSDSIPASIEYK